MEKVDVVKRLIRSHNYRDMDRVYVRCLELGIHVNKSALNRFALKLSLIDRASRTTIVTDETAKHNTSPFSANREQLASPLEHKGTPSIEHIAPPHKPAPATKEISYAEAKRREAEITFELGAMKIKEHALLEELNTLAKIIDEKH